MHLPLQHTLGTQRESSNVYSKKSKNRYSSRAKPLHMRPCAAKMLIEGAEHSTQHALNRDRKYGAKD